ncbi:hypothetical protein LTR86_008736 [Recurvomyces mirabilis]|nr:hypothetical protein LTR86_008736 [Recurvomyces mirabilis]
MADTLVIGVDFGTTFSGVAFAYSGGAIAPDQINIIKSWPGGNNITSDKVPSELVYTSRNASGSAFKTVKDSTDGSGSFVKLLTSNGSDVPLDISKLKIQEGKQSDMRWGFQIDVSEERLRCIKLLLDPGQAVPNYVSLPDTEQQLFEAGKTVGAAAADLLGAVFGHAKEAMDRSYGAHFVNDTKVKVACTVPAVWSDAAKEATLSAAKAAGMKSIVLVSEPEAGALYTLQAIQPNKLDIGSTFVVIDAGGGTVDLITYRIKQLTPLRLVEVVQGSGSFCGAAFLNIRFEDLIRSRMGNDTFQDLRVRKPKCLQHAMKYFEESVKRNFDPDEDRLFHIPVPGAKDDEHLGILDGFLNITSGDIAELFRPILSDIYDLIQGQIDKVHEQGQVVNGLVLIGGFGRSQCLRKCLEARFGEVTVKKEGRGSATKNLSRTHHIAVLQPVNAWTAVVRGAVLRGLEQDDTVLSRIARRNYGVIYNTDFDPEVHDDSLRAWSRFYECWQATNQMQWFIRTGQTVSSSSPITFGYRRSFFAQDNRIVQSSLVYCDLDQAPSTFSNAVGSATRKLCQLTTDLGRVPAELWTQHVNNSGLGYSTLSYKFAMQIESGGLRFELLVDGVVYGQVTAAFE